MRGEARKTAVEIGGYASAGQHVREGKITQHKREKGQKAGRAKIQSQETSSNLARIPRP